MMKDIVHIQQDPYSDYGALVIFVLLLSLFLLCRCTEGEL